jgi:hypothetical protein
MPKSDDKTLDYLGDGVYCSFDGYQTWIWTSNGERESEKIALEVQVLSKLIEYDKRMRNAS